MEHDWFLLNRNESVIDVCCSKRLAEPFRIHFDLSIEIVADCSTVYMDFFSK